MEDFRGKVVVVTGAGSGIGRETALAFARRGARLVVCDIDGGGLRGTRDELESMGCEVYSEVVDVSRAWQVKEFCENTYKKMGRVDVLVNNAGVGLGGKLEDMSLDDWEWIMGANLWGVVYGCHFFYPRMIAQGGGTHIVNVASGAALGPLPAMTAYCCTKSAVLGFSETLRGEAALHGIGVTAVCPGIVATNIASTSRVLSGTRRSTPEEFKEKGHKLFQRRRYPPAKVAEALVRAVKEDTGVAVVGPETHLLDFTYRLSREVYGYHFRRMVKLHDRWA